LSKHYLRRAKHPYEDSRPRQSLHSILMVAVASNDAVINMEFMKPRVFISYASQDSLFAEFVKTKVELFGHEVWRDQDELKAGQEWRQEIDMAIMEANVVILIITPDFCDSAYVTYEWAFAIGKAKRLIPLVFKTANTHPRISGYHFLDFTSRKLPWEDLKKHLEDSIPQQNTTDKSIDLVSGMTVEELKKLIVGTMALANATAKGEGRAANPGELSDAALNIANANITIGQAHTKVNTILWVDDNPDNNTYERSALSALGYKFELATSTKQALQILRSTKFDAIISDMGRREGPKEGYVLLEKIRETDKVTPFFIYAGSNSPAHKREAKERGAHGTTNNPSELIELVTKQTSRI
jgi:CheY-like chemotaxis protein